MSRGRIDVKADPAYWRAARRAAWRVGDKDRMELAKQHLRRLLGIEPHADVAAACGVGGGEEVTDRGATLRGHYLNTNPANWDLRANIASQRWDIVVLQGNSTEALPANATASQEAWLASRLEADSRLQDRDVRVLPFAHAAVKHRCHQRVLVELADGIGRVALEL